MKARPMAPRALPAIVLLAWTAHAGASDFETQIDALVRRGVEYPAQALSALSELRPEHRNSPRERRVLLQAMGDVEAHAGAPARAGVFADQLQALAADDPTGLAEASAKLVRAQMAEAVGQLDAAAVLAQSALSTFQAGCAKISSPDCDYRAAWAALALLERRANGLGVTVTATKHAQAALELSEAAGDAVRQAGNLGSLALLAQGRGERDAAVWLMSRARRIAAQTYDPAQQARLSNVQAQLAQMQGDTRGSLQAHEEALALAAQARAPHLEAKMLANLGDAYTRMGRSADALRAAERALPIVRSYSDVHAERVLISNIGVAKIASSGTVTLNAGSGASVSGAVAAQPSPIESCAVGTKWFRAVGNSASLLVISRPIDRSAGAALRPEAVAVHVHAVRARDVRSGCAEEDIDRPAVRVGKRDAVEARAAHDEVADPVTVDVADGQRRPGEVTRPIPLRSGRRDAKIRPDRAAEDPIRLARPVRTGSAHDPLVDPVAVQVAPHHARAELHPVLRSSQRDVHRGGPEIDRGAGHERTPEDGVGASRVETGREGGVGCAEQDVGLPVAVDVAGPHAGSQLVTRGMSQDAKVDLGVVAQIDHRRGHELRATEDHVHRTRFLVLERRAEGRANDEVVEPVAVDVARGERVASIAVRHRTADGGHGNRPTEELDPALEPLLTVEDVHHAAVVAAEAVALSRCTDREVGDAVSVEVAGRDGRRDPR